MSTDYNGEEITYNDQNSVPRQSAYVKPSLAITRLLGIAPGDDTDPDPLNQLDWLDPLDPRYQAALNATGSIGPYVYSGEPITTIAVAKYQTHSAAGLIVAFNGFLHPDEIPNGYELELPNLAEFEAAFDRAKLAARRTMTF